MSLLPAWLHSLAPLVLADIRRRYAGSALGALWAILSPILETLAYVLVFGLFLGVSTRGGLPYIVLIASGLFPWISFREALEGSASVLADNRWVRRSRVPMGLLVARLVLVSMPRAALSLLVVLGYAWGAGRAPSFLALCAPLLALLLQCLLAYGLCLSVAPLTTLMPDLKPTLVSLLTLLTFASPIVYPEEAAKGGLLAVLEWNPFTHLLRLYRSPAQGSGSREILLSAAAAASAAIAAWVVGEAVQSRLWFKARDLL